MQRSEDKGQILYLLTSVSMAWYLVIEMSHRWRSFSSFLREVSVIVRLLTLLAESDLEWILALWTVCVCVCVCVGVKRWEYERTRERCRTAAYWTVMNSYDWQSMNKPLKSHCLQNRVHALSNIQHPMMFLIVCHLEDAWNLNKYTNINEKNTAMHHLQWNNCVQECRGTVPSTAETAAELISSCLSWSVLDLLVRTSIGEWVGEKDGAETGWSRTISRPLSKDVVLFSCCLFSSSCNFSSFFLIRCLALLEGLCFFAAATSCVLVVGNDRLFDASLFDGTLRFV